MEKKHFSWIGVGVAVVGVCFLWTGIFRGEVDTVYAKAIQICLECIGIG